MQFLQYKKSKAQKYVYEFITDIAHAYKAHSGERKQINKEEIYCLCFFAMPRCKIFFNTVSLDFFCGLLFLELSWGFVSSEI